MPEQPNKSKRPNGRPTKYKPKYCQAIVDYFDIDVQEYRSGEKKFPTFADFAHTIGVSHDSIPRWAEKYPDFCVAYKKAKSLLESFFIRAGMESAINTTFAIFYSKNCLGWKDKQEIDQSVNLAGSLKINIVRNKDGKNDSSGSDIENT